MRSYTVCEDLYAGLTASDVTSNLIDTRDAFDLTVSVYTTGGSSSTLTYQISNWSTRSGIPEASWSAWTVLVPSTSSLWQPPLGARFARLLRNVSSATWVAISNKQGR